MGSGLISAGHGILAGTFFGPFWHCFFGIHDFRFRSTLGRAETNGEIRTDANFLL